MYNRRGTILYSMSFRSYKQNKLLYRVRGPWDRPCMVDGVLINNVLSYLIDFGEFRTLVKWNDGVPSREITGQDRDGEMRESGETRGWVTWRWRRVRGSLVLGSLSSGRGQGDKSLFLGGNRKQVREGYVTCTLFLGYRENQNQPCPPFTFDL